MNNKEVRQAIFNSNLKKYQVAAAACITPVTLSRWLQREMSREQRARVLEAIDDLKKGR